MKKELKTFVDPMIAYEGMVLVMGFIVVIVLYLWVMIYYDKTTTGIVVFCTLNIVGLASAIAFFTANLFIRVIFTTDGIRLKAPFRTAKTIPYWQFPNILRGRYFHWGFGREFIVFTNRRLSALELNQINAFGCGENFIKVKYSRRRYQKLCEILPVKQRIRLELLFPENKTL